MDLPPPSTGGYMPPHTTPVVSGGYTGIAPATAGEALPPAYNDPGFAGYSERYVPSAPPAPPGHGVVPPVGGGRGVYTPVGNPSTMPPASMANPKGGTAMGDLMATRQHSAALAHQRQPTRDPSRV